MSKADQIFIDNCNDILENGFNDENQSVRARWDDGAPAHTIKNFGLVNRYNLSEEFPVITLRRTPFKKTIDELLWIWQKKCNSLPEIFKIAVGCTPDDIFVIGGQSIYEQLLPYCSVAYITKFTSQTIKTADSFFPNLDLLPSWEIAEGSGESIYNEYVYTFYKYINKSPLQLIN